VAESSNSGAVNGRDVARRLAEILLIAAPGGLSIEKVKHDNCH
jgi:hypothetical protein